MSIAVGKAVRCEKPIDLNLARVNACAARIKGTKLPILLGLDRRCDPGHSAARAAMLAGEIGDLHQVIISWRDPGLSPGAYLEAAGGLFRDMTIHDFDLARFMPGEEPVEVFVPAGALIDPAPGRELNKGDSVMIVMRTASGKRCHINNSRTAVYGHGQRVELLRTKGMRLSDNREPQELRRYTATMTETSAPCQFFFLERYLEAFMAEIDGFVERVEKGAQPLASFEDDRRALMLAQAACLFLRDERLVKVSEIGSQTRHSVGSVGGTEAVSIGGIAGRPPCAAAYQTLVHPVPNQNCNRDPVLRVRFCQRPARRKEPVPDKVDDRRGVVRA